MIPAKLIKNLEKIGFDLDFPGYESTEDFILEILGQDNSRLDTAIPLLIKEGFDYKKLKESLDSSKIKRLNKIIRIANKILLQEKEDNSRLKNIIQENGIKERFSSNEFSYFYSAYKETQKHLEN